MCMNHWLQTERGICSLCSFDVVVFLFFFTEIRLGTMLSAVNCMHAFMRHEVLV